MSLKSPPFAGPDDLFKSGTGLDISDVVYDRGFEDGLACVLCPKP